MPSGGGNAVKRLVILICVLFLMFDLADDGRLGKAKFNLPTPQAKTSLLSFYHPVPTQNDFQDGIAGIDLPGIPRHQYTQPVIPAPLPLKIIKCCHLSSAGGIPL
jgi:hypothetical protein